MGAEGITFGTDGWRALIDDGFDDASVALVAAAIGTAFASDAPGGVVYVGYDTRRDAGRYARLVASVLATFDLDIRLSNRFVPTPALCMAVARDDDACGGVMLTASHNPAEYLGVKIRMNDGGASPVEFTDRIEVILAGIAVSPAPSDAFSEVDIAQPYLDALLSGVDADAIGALGATVVVDPLHGAACGYLSEAVSRLGGGVLELHGSPDPSFGGLHPEPIPPWTDEAAKAVVASGADVGFVTDGDADRLGAIDARGRFVNPHTILALLIAHLVEDRDRSGSVVRTLSGSELVARQAKRFGLDLVTTPIGFKWIYERFIEGGVMVGGEESGGIGIPEHLRERDGLYVSLLLLEMMAMRKKSLADLVDELQADLGPLVYSRRDLRVAPEVMRTFLSMLPAIHLDEIDGRPVRSIDRTDGVKFVRDDESWLLLRPSGTEPLVRVYAEAPTQGELERLLDAGCLIAEGRA